MISPSIDLDTLSGDLAEYIEVQTKCPIAVADLWVPYCHRWDGLGSKSPRARGCGKAMAHIGPGAYRCNTPDCQVFGVVERRTSQRESILRAMEPRAIASLIGGANRAGKTEGALQLAVAVAGGRSSWASRSWCIRNGLPIEILPDRPDPVVWVSALSYSDALEYHRPTLDKYLPEGCRRRSWESNHQAVVYLSGGGRIVSKAAALGRKGARRRYQGAPVDLIILDEEHEIGIFEECLARTGDFNGKVVLSMTPLMGLTWPYQAFVTDPGDGFSATTIYGLDNPYVASSNLRRRFAHLEPHKKDARLFGSWAAAKGRIYPGFDRAIHVIPDRPLSPDWARFRSIDFGSRFACIWAAMDPSEDALYVYISQKTEDLTIGQNVRLIKGSSGSESYEWTIGDPADRTAITTLRREHGIPCLPARKMVEPGIDHVADRLKVQENGFPKLYIFESCNDLVLELEKYRRNDRGEVVKEDDHLADALRYLCTYLIISGAMGAS